MSNSSWIKTEFEMEMHTFVRFVVGELSNLSTCQARAVASICVLNSQFIFDK